MIYLNSYHPLAKCPSGRKAAATHNLPPYADASCRREPDLEASLPAISALCRTTKFAPRLKVGDVVTYITVSSFYPPITDRRHYRLTAVLEVLKRFEDHESAAAWYSGQGFPIPGNCIVPENPPLPLEKTVGFYFADDEALGKKVKRVPEQVAEWDRFYADRVSVCSLMLACKPLYTELHSPPAFDSKEAEAIFLEYGKMPGTLNPPAISPADFHRLMEHCATGVQVEADQHRLKVHR
ncbi:hypothetical protein [Armatimonas sp.]|uniref:hypothetical protein n=1 Tax=Armatimonas sp. TaxID=1872638 RepID=UPI00286B9FE3|nr:hypothetical protein [Armatimonas sp.]